MKVSFRAGRYLVALLWSWSLPVVIGGAAGYSLSTWQVLEILKASDELFFDVLDAYTSRVTESCSAAKLKPTFCINYPERSEPSVDLVSQHWREAASLWVAQGAQGETLIKRRTNVQSEDASNCHGHSLLVIRGSPERARGNPCQALHECAEAKVQLILRESLAKPGNKAVAQN